MNKSYQPLHHKYRPKKFDEVVGQDAITTTLKQAIKTNRIAPAYLLSGPRGTGKTSSARILARSLNCLASKIPTTDPCGECDTCKNISSGTSLDVIEIDAASNTGVDNIRELIERSRFAPVQSRWKAYVIDECHMLSTAAFNALLKTLEEPPKNVIFILATTDPQRVLPTILSRCQRFDFKRISMNILIEHLKMIASKEEINIESEAVEVIAQRAQGGLRDAESMLDQLSLLDPPITITNVWDLVGVIPEKEILLITTALIESNPVTLIESYRKLLDKGRDPLLILQGLASILRDLVVAFSAPNKPELLAISNEFKDHLQTIAKQLTLDQLLHWQSQLKGSENQIRHSMQPRLWLEILLLGMLPKTFNSQDSSFISIDQKENIDLKINLNKSTKYEEENKPINQENLNNKENIDSSKINDIKLSEKVNLEEVWQQVLGRLELPSTKMLLSQQAKLIRLTKEKAIINVADNWIGMVQSRIKLLEQAIEDTLGGRREIIIDNQLLSLPIEEKVISRTIQDELVQENINNNSVKKDLVHKRMEDLSKEVPKEEEEIKNLNSSSNKTHNAKEKAIDNGAKRVADFFNGEIL